MLPAIVLLLLLVRAASQTTVKSRWPCLLACFPSPIHSEALLPGPPLKMAQWRLCTLSWCLSQEEELGTPTMS